MKKIKYLKKQQTAKEIEENELKEQIGKIQDFFSGLKSELANDIMQSKGITK